MTDIRCVPCNILTWPDIVDLLPDQKHIFVYLWFCRFANSIGCYSLPRGMAAVELSLSENSLAEALREFERRQLLASDEKTSEIFVLSWFRFNTFKSQIRKNIAATDFKKIQSSELCAIVEKSMTCVTRESKLSKLSEKTKKQPTEIKIIEPDHMRMDSAAMEKGMGLFLRIMKGGEKNAPPPLKILTFCNWSRGLIAWFF